MCQPSFKASVADVFSSDLKTQLKDASLFSISLRKKKKKKTAANYNVNNFDCKIYPPLQKYPNMKTMCVSECTKYSRWDDVLIGAFMVMIYLLIPKGKIIRFQM